MPWYSLEWNRHHKEILSSHGFSERENRNQLCLSRYPSMSKIGETMGHSSRVLQIAESPDGCTVASAEADEAIRFREIFGPPSQSSNSAISELDGFLTLKSSPIR
ncbi:hypothetical protein NMG60_11012127 [Bertholletia excelsa]